MKREGLAEIVFPEKRGSSHWEDYQAIPTSYTPLHTEKKLRRRVGREKKKGKRRREREKVMVNW